MVRELLEFEIDTQKYGLPLISVAEVVRAVAIRRLPSAPGVIEGVIDLRGRIVPVLDMRRRFRHPHRTLDPAEHFVVARAGDRLVALRADRVVGIASLPVDSVEPPESSVRGVKFVAGIAKTPDGIILIHDLATFLTESEGESLDLALAETPT